MVRKNHQIRHTAGVGERRHSFNPQYEPFRDEDAVELADEVDGALWFMNPTRASFDIYTERGCTRDGPSHGGAQQDGGQSHDRSSSDVQYKWTSRDNRKGRHPLQITGPLASHVGSTPSATSLAGILHGIRRMASTLSSDVSYIGATAMTAACVFLVTNAILSFLPYANPNFQPPGWITALEGVLTLVGCALFLTSSSISFIEAANQDQRGCFGWKHESSAQSASSEAVQSDSTTLVPDWCKISRRNSIANLFRGSNKQDEMNGDRTPLLGKHDCDNSAPSWRFFPTMQEIRHHLLYDIGFLACSVLLISSAIYCACAAAALITILTTGNIIVWIRIPQVTASLGFMASSALFMVETQEEWWRPQYNAIGWRVLLPQYSN
jgi:hypothetical protein